MKGSCLKLSANTSESGQNTQDTNKKSNYNRRSLLSGRVLHKKRTQQSTQTDSTTLKQIKRTSKLRSNPISEVRTKRRAGTKRTNNKKSGKITPKPTTQA